MPIQVPEGVDVSRQYVRLVPVEIVRLLQSDNPVVRSEVERVVVQECRRGAARVRLDDWVVLPKFGKRSVLMSGSF